MVPLDKQICKNVQNHYEHFPLYGKYMEPKMPNFVDSFEFHFFQTEFRP